ncbi:MAG: hypothetical protein ACM34N_09215 [Ignavibacteria bacterium]
MNISLIVYSLLGEKIKDLFSGFKEPGIYNFEFDGKDLGKDDIFLERFHLYEAKYFGSPALSLHS